ncbi:2Fe-2S iron-sulfur cluster-binding protein [Streptomyces uncialis]|uniref:Ferredoxin n=1 Tax=Streptomyces uncialis TaxID=1048205 RepID=A0A1Q4V652_9ACTN|nr:2Fe-2S iron-sulfur cluster-binding protein [Streptomyces uncialis]MCX4659616.1 2Fe-2S iron-sulfur cluster-binding protein [Streptomyces uncialis]OKH93352.1 ferredoxin [Streptomyces uncialis]WST67713.1 2Fe-2S iron-sulfur cluster-binding protein [Streptomyces uncialis]WTE13659.1 2Fe-2S iron-sulfur cluster-binding protein [Streptomyces uncialis]
MPEITYVAVDGTACSVEVPLGTSVMRGAVFNDIDGIVAQCGGNAQCATCHVYVDETSLDALEQAQPEEEHMLGFTAADRLPNSRLSCQLKVTGALDGLIVHLPERQY